MKTNNGIIQTLDTCIGCSRCVAACPAMGTNISVQCDGRRLVEPNDEKCLHCGQCINACGHDARVYLDDTDTFLNDLRAGKNISLIIDPSIFVLYPQYYHNLLGYFKDLGVEKIYDASFGADIYTWFICHFIEGHKGSGFIASDCPVAVELIEKYKPGLIHKLLPVYSPSMCTAIYARNYENDPREFAYITPCLARRNEIDACAEQTNITYHVTFSKLMEALEHEDMTHCYAEPTMKSEDLGYLYAICGGLRENIGFYTGDHARIYDVDGFGQNSLHERQKFLNMLESTGVTYKIIDAYSCHLGMLGSPAIKDGESLFPQVVQQSEKIRHHALGRAGTQSTPKERLANLDKKFDDIDLSAFRREFKNQYKQPFKLPKDVLDAIFKTMGKNTHQARHVDCSLCGYSTCTEMARAIASGYAAVDDCIHFAQRETIRLSETDNLTGILNQSAFVAKVSDYLWDHTEDKFVLAYLDVQNFKIINDLYGFDAGDTLLKCIAQSLSDYVKDNGLCGRLLGDHFVALLPEGNLAAHDFMNHIHKGLMSINQKFAVSIDFGFYSIVNPEIPVAQMIDLAHIAQSSIKGSFDMHWAHYDEAMRKKMRHEAFVVKEMQRALDEDEFKIFLQPQYDYRTNKMVSAEALTRWMHPGHKMMTPDQFIPVFEKNNFIKKLDLHVFEKVCALQRRGLDENLRVIPIAVNFSRVDLFSRELADDLEVICAKYDIDKSLVRLEITESAYANEPEQLVAAIEKLRAVGFVVEMDDFGSGYSSLNTLYEMPVDAVKLDMRFIDGSQTQKGRFIIDTIVHMMKLLDIPLIAEGVETKNQASFLHSIGCNIMQGYFYARPMPVEEFVLLP